MEIGASLKTDARVTQFKKMGFNFNGGFEAKRWNFVKVRVSFKIWGFGLGGAHD